jgi:hypothetical protein
MSDLKLDDDRFNLKTDQVYILNDATPNPIEQQKIIAESYA